MKPSKCIIATILALGFLVGLLTISASAEEFTTTPMITGGVQFTLALKRDGTVWGWGSNSYGELGQGSSAPPIISAPVQVKNMSKAIAIAADNKQSFALKSDGTVWAWGWNQNAMLGDGTTSDRNIPVQVKNLRGIIAISSGSWHTLALKSDGTVWGWGDNKQGQFGGGAITQYSTPIQVTGLSDVTAIAAGGYGFSLALKSDGTVWGWGSNDYGQLGDGTTTQCYPPVQVSGLSNVTAIMAGTHFSLAMKNDGTVWGWGRNDYGQLGDGTTTERHAPVQVSGLSDVTAIAANDTHHSLALKGDGTVWAWGYNKYGRLGDGTIENRSTPVQVSGLSDVTAITTGSSHSLVLKSNGMVWAWGYNYCSQLGQGDSGFLLVASYRTPVQVKGVGGTGWFDVYSTENNPDLPMNTIFSTKYESNFKNWFKFIVLFGWIWMWF